MNLRTFAIPIGVVVLVAAMVTVGAFLNKSSDSNSNAGQVLGAKIVENEHRIGNPTATIELIEYSDLQCSACATYSIPLKELLEKQGDQINFAYRHFPLKSIHKNAEKASYASEAAAKQGKFWEMVDKMFETQTSWSVMPDPTPAFLRMAEDMGMNGEQFIRDMESNETKLKVDTDYNTGMAAGFNSTPTFVLNGQKVSLPGDYEGMVKALGLTNE